MVSEVEGKQRGNALGYAGPASLPGSHALLVVLLPVLKDFPAANVSLVIPLVLLLQLLRSNIVSAVPPRAASSVRTT